MKVGVGFADHQDPRAGGALAAGEAMSRAGMTPGGPAPDLCLLFTTEHYNPALVLDGVRSAVGDCPMAGGSGGGVITENGLSVKGIAVGVFQDPGLTVRTGLVPGIASAPLDAAWKAAAELARSAGLPTVEEDEADGDEGTGEPGSLLAIPDGLADNVADTVRGLYRALGHRYHYCGGGTGDNLRYVKTYQFTEKGSASGAMALALIAGCPVRVVMDHGWKPCGEAMIITSSSGKVVATIDHVPAVQAYRHHVAQDFQEDDFPRVALRHPLGIPDADENYLIRDPVRLDGDGRLHFVTEVPQSAVAHVMAAETEALVDTARRLAARAVQGVKQPAFALVFDCISRYLVLGDAFGRELDAIRDGLGSRIPVIGMLTFGEVGAARRVPLFQNKTLVLAVGGDPAAGPGSGRA